MDYILLQSSEWLKDCGSAHQMCSLEARSRASPKRLIYLGSNRGSGNRVSIAQSADSRHDYCALSYCWGDDVENFGRTTKSNLQERIVGFEATDLPRTIQDSIFLCKCLGVLYLWIDSICIIQDDPEDWKRESPLMDHTYSNALFTLAAISSRHANEGLFATRSAASNDLWQPCRPPNVGFTPWSIIQDPWVFLDLEISVALESKMSSRAWTLQEDILSPKKLYWTKYGIIWSCPAYERKEWQEAEQQGPTRDGTQVEIEKGQCPNFLQRRRAAFIHKNACSYVARRAWGDALQQYLPRKISRSEDRLAAVGALVKVLQPQLQDTYFAGLWLRSLPEDLLWRVSGTIPKAATQRQLSWSWATLPSCITARAWLGYSEFENIRTACSFQDIVIEPSDSAIFGPVYFGRLRLRTKKRPYPNQYARRYEAAHGPGPAFDCASHYIANDLDTDVALDGLECLLILDLFGREFCLLVEPVQQELATVRRVGIVEIISKNAPTAPPLLCGSSFGDGGEPGSSELREFPTDSFFKDCLYETVELI